MYGFSDTHFLSPIRRITIIGPIFIERSDKPIFHMNETYDMKVRRMIRRIDFYCRNIAIFYYVYSLDGSVPFTGIVTICSNILVYGELLIGTVPADYSIIGEIRPQRFPPLMQNIFPERLDIHHHRDKTPIQRMALTGSFIISLQLQNHNGKLVNSHG